MAMRRLDLVRRGTLAILPRMLAALPALPICAALVVASPFPSIAPNVAPLFVGEQVVVEGLVRSSERDGNVVRLRLGKSPRDISVALVLGLLTDFPEAPEEYFLGERVRVAGVVDSFRGRVEMVIRDPRNIRVVGVPSSSPPLPPPGAGPADEVSVQEQLESLQQQLRRMEQRLQRLEGTAESEPPASVDGE
jgi:hypothetical protein